MARDENHKKAQHNWYEKNKEKVYSKAVSRRKETIEWFKNYKRTCNCVECGLSGEKYPDLICFHHKDPKEKDSNISKMIYNNGNREKIINEINKCQPLCINCHRKKHKHYYNDSLHTSHQNKIHDWYTNIKKEMKCEICGEKEIACLDLHHVQNKTYKISRMISYGASIELILEELNKCRCLCANCHVIEHERLNT